MRWLCLLLLLAAPVGAQVPGPGVAVMVHHPYPDDADPFGFDFAAGRDAFVSRFRHLDENGDGFDFPSVVFDGVDLVESIPDGDPQAATTAAYDAAVRARQGEAGITLTVFALAGETLDIMIQAQPVVPLEDRLRLWVALVEDGIHFAPPPALSNGITEHPFTVRAIVDLGQQNLSAEVRHREPFAIAQEWDLERMYAVVWFEQDAGHGLRFAAHEVAQATMHPVLSEAPTQQVRKGVLVEAYSATWCKPCLFGDRAIEEIAETHGIVFDREARAGWTYLSMPSPVLLAAAVLAALAGAFFGGRR